jgi:transcriptional regulator with XRE-family HTH domain
MMKPTFNTEAFHAALNAVRASRGLNWKEVAEQAGVQASTITRIGQGKKPDVNGLAALLSWSNLQAETFIPKGSKEAPDPIAQIAALIRMDPALSHNSAQLMEDIVLTTYNRLRNGK